MGEPFLGEIRLFSFTSAPRGWALCNGQFLPINQNQALFALLGTTYGGNGQTTFALPDFRDRVPMHHGNQGGHNLGERGGSDSVTITIQNMPAHLHTLRGVVDDGTAALPPTNAFFAKAQNNFYAAPANLGSMMPDVISNVGGSQPHENKQPYLVISFMIALQGIFPSQN